MLGHHAEGNKAGLCREGVGVLAGREGGQGSVQGYTGRQDARFLGRFPSPPTLHSEVRMVKPNLLTSCHLI